MKTSNKIIISFGLALILIPILGMVYVSRVKYKVGEYTDVVKKPDNFSTPSKYMVALTAATPFETVNFLDAKGTALSVHLIKDEKFGIKISEEFKDQISIVVDANGELQILFKEKSTKDRDRNFTEIYVYAPTVKTLTVAHADEIYLTANKDSLQLNVSKSGSTNLESQAQINHLSILAADAQNINVRESKIKSLSLNLTNTNFKTELNSYDDLSITSAKNAEINIFGYTYGTAKSFTIANLTINTSDKAEVKIENIAVTKAAGHFSDLTSVQMPAVNLNQMYRK